MNGIIYSAECERRLNAFYRKKPVRSLCRRNSHKRRVRLGVVECYCYYRFIYNDIAFKLGFAEEFLYSRFEKVFRVRRTCALSAQIQCRRKRSCARVVSKTLRIKQKPRKEHIRFHLRKRSGRKHLLKKFGQQLRCGRCRRLYIHNARADFVFARFSVMVYYYKITYIAYNVRRLAK